MNQRFDYSINKKSSGMTRSIRNTPCPYITFQDKTGEHTHRLSAGQDDEICVGQNNTETYVLHTNPVLGYIGLDIFQGCEKQGEMFFEGHQVREMLNENFDCITAINWLMQYI